MDMVKQSLEARQRSLKRAIRKRTEREQDFGDWRHTNLDELIGRLQEVNNTLDMMGHYCK